MPKGMEIVYRTKSRGNKNEGAEKSETASSLNK